jgi:uncharacterized protein (TIGR04141 family)
MTGIDSLSVRVRGDISKTRKLLASYLAKSEEDTYKKDFSWIDHVAEVRDSKLANELTEIVIDDINIGTTKKVWAAIPATIEWTSFDGFRFGRVSSGYSGDDVTLNRMISALEGEPVTHDGLKKRKVFCMAIGNPHPVTSWPYIQCLTAEVTHNDSTYLMTGGSWYKIQPDFVKKVDADIETIPASEIPFPTWGDEHEAAYNSRVTATSGGKIALMDRELVSHTGMASPIEFCDLYLRDGHMIHVKRYGQSSVLSHLFAQGLVSANLLIGDVEFRRALNSKLPKSHRFGDPLAKPNSGDLEVAFAVGSSELGPLNLPFFSRVTLRNTYRTLTQSLGFRASLTKIQISKFA